MRITVKNDLKLSPVKPMKCQHITVLQQRKRAERSGLLWNLLKSGMQKGGIVFFSAEKIFILEAKSNPHNNRVLAQHPEDVSEVMLKCLSEFITCLNVPAALSKT